MARATPGILTYHRADGTEERIKLHQDVTTLGRSDSCAVVIALPVISRLHARIELQHDRYMLVDAGSANGTFVNGKRIEQGTQLSTGDEIWLGSSDVTLTFPDREATLFIQPSILPPPLFIDEDARTVKAYGIPVQLSPLDMACCCTWRITPAPSAHAKAAFWLSGANPTTTPHVRTR